jgi:mono/diheme cytochrome c family protein
VPLIGLAMLCCVTPLMANQEVAPPSREATERGRTTFRQYCGVCHGDSGKGDAPGAQAMKPPPTNLTTLTKRYRTFPAAQVEATLKGTDQTKAHSSGMMVWRAFFLADANGDEAVANARVRDVIAFIASIQPK